MHVMFLSFIPIIILILFFGQTILTSNICRVVGGKHFHDMYSVLCVIFASVYDNDNKDNNDDEKSSNICRVVGGWKL